MERKYSLWAWARRARPWAHGCDISLTPLVSTWSRALTDAALHLLSLQGHYPYCLPYGNRRAVQCTPIFSEASSPPSVGSSLPGWEACGKVVAQERADFFEFVVSSSCTCLGFTSSYTYRRGADHSLPSRLRGPTNTGVSNSPSTWRALYLFPPTTHTRAATVYPVVCAHRPFNTR